MDNNFEDFQKYFNSSFWKAFGKKGIFNDFPRTKYRKEYVLRSLFHDITSRKYHPDTPQLLLNRDKGNGVTRVVPVFTIRDYCVYYYCIKKLEPLIALNRVPNTFGGWTLSGIIRKTESDEMEKRKSDFDTLEEFQAEAGGFSISEYSFNPVAWTRAYGDLNAKLYATAQETNLPFVAEMDVANFYDSIRLDMLEVKIREIAGDKIAEVINLLFFFLNYWNKDINTYNKQTVGLPQDAMGDCSRILANFYLQPYDKYIYGLCQSNNSRFLRYSDDQFIFSNSKETLNYLIFKSSKFLNTLGLSINQKKVRISTSAELIDYRSFKAFDILKNENDKANILKVNKVIDYYLSLVENDGLKNVKDRGNPLLNKILSCKCLAELDLPRRSKILACVFDNDYLASCKPNYLEKIYDLLTPTEKAAFIRELNSLSEKILHNAFHYGLLEFMIKKRLNSIDLHKRILYLTTI